MATTKIKSALLFLVFCMVVLSSGLAYAGTDNLDAQASQNLQGSENVEASIREDTTLTALEGVVGEVVATVDSAVTVTKDAATSEESESINQIEKPKLDTAASGNSAISPDAAMRDGEANNEDASSGDTLSFVPSGTQGSNDFIIEQTQLLKENEVYLIESKLDTDRALDVSGGSNSDSANIQIYEGNSTLAQYFRVAWLGSGWYNFTNLNSGKYLDAAGAGTASGTNVQQYTGNGTNAQKWGLVSLGDGFYQLVPYGSQSTRLDISGGSTANGANVQIWESNVTNAQAFKIEKNQALSDAYAILKKDGYVVLTDDYYSIFSKLDDSMCLDVSAASKDSSANIDLYESNATDAQKYVISYDQETKTYTIMNLASGKYLDVAGASTVNGSNVWQYEGNGTLAQRWLASAAKGCYSFSSACNGLFLDVSGASTLGGNNLQVWRGNGSVAQMFNLLDKDWYFYSGASNAAMAMIETAERFQGWEYVWGGRSPSVGFDCAGLVEYCANTVYGMGIDTMHTNASSLFYSFCNQISAAEAVAGDICFFRGTYGNDVDYISHVVIYCGQGICYGAGDSIGYMHVADITNIYGRVADVIYARLRV